MKWKPIESAPKDGTVILCYVAGSLYPAIARWVITPMGRCGWCTDANYLSEDELEVYMAETSYNPTHWAEIGDLPQ